MLPAAVVVLDVCDAGHPDETGDALVGSDRRADERRERALGDLLDELPLDLVDHVQVAVRARDQRRGMLDDPLENGLGVELLGKRQRGRVERFELRDRAVGSAV